jgi:hypothetical protein
MVVSKFKREASGPGRRAAEVSLREGKQKSIVLREAEFEQPDTAQALVLAALEDTCVLKARARRSWRTRPAGTAKNFSYHLRNCLQLSLRIW